MRIRLSALAGILTAGMAMGASTSDAAGVSDPEAPRVVIIGASYARGWTISSIEGRPVLNKGVGGERTQDMRARFSRDVVAQEPSAVIIWGFINNLFRSQSADLTPAMEQARADIAAMVEQADGQGIQSIVATEVTITGPGGLKDRIVAVIGRWLGKESYQDRINERVREVNAWMREFATERGLVLLDFEQVLSDKHGRRARAYAADDGSHISSAGYAALSEYIETVPIWRASPRSP